MGMEFFFQLIDREVVDPLLQLRWPEFLRRYRKTVDDFAELVDFCVDEVQEDEEALQRLFRTRTLRWTLQHSSPQYWFLSEFGHFIPAVKKHCPEIHTHPFEQTDVLFAIAAHGLLQAQMDVKTTATVLQLHGWPALEDFLNLSSKVDRVLTHAWEEVSETPKPIFPWQKGDFHGDGFTTLDLRDTRRFLKLLNRAWNENWELSSLRPEFFAALSLSAKQPFTVRKSELVKEIVRHARALEGGRLCMLQFFG